MRPQRTDIILEPLLFEKGVYNLGGSEGVVTAGIKGIEQGAVPVLIRFPPVRQFLVAYAVGEQEIVEVFLGEVAVPGPLLPLAVCGIDIGDEIVRSDYVGVPDLWERQVAEGSPVTVREVREIPGVGYDRHLVEKVFD